MITKISGVLLGLHEEAAVLGIDAFEYEVRIPEYTRRQLQGQVGQPVSLHTLQYIEGNAAQGGRLTPRLIGFLNEAEREFFELFCSVDGLGVKKALRAMVRPVPDVAQLIESQDLKGLSALPGLGQATAERVVAKLRRKMPKFALLVARPPSSATETEPDVVNATFDVLLSLGHSEAEARRLLDGALASKKKFKDEQALLEAVYQYHRG